MVHTKQKSTVPIPQSKLNRQMRQQANTNQKEKENQSMGDEPETIEMVRLKIHKLQESLALYSNS